MGEEVGYIPIATQTPSTALRHPSSLEEGAGKRCSEAGSGAV